MKLDKYLHWVPTIEKWVAALKPDAIVMGLGPSAHLLPWIDQGLLAGVRIWGVNDACKIYPVHDLVILDPPVKELHPDTHRFDHIAAGRPDRIHIYLGSWKDSEKKLSSGWQSVMPKHLLSICRMQDWRVFNPDLVSKESPFDLQHEPPDTLAVSPVGAMTLAWKEGARRIGIIGMDCMPNHHKTWMFVGALNCYFKKVTTQARGLGGEIASLSPFSAVDRLHPPQTEEAAWQDSPSGLAPTSGSVEPVLSRS